MKSKWYYHDRDRFLKYYNNVKSFMHGVNRRYENASLYVENG